MASSEAALRDGPLDLVLDIGKTRSKLFVIDAGGQVLATADAASTAVEVQVDGACYRALDTDGLAGWLESAIVALGPLRARLARAIVSGHGAAVAAIEDGQLAWPVPDYECPVFDERADGWAATVAAAFGETQSPDLPRGLNLATQLDWLERHLGERARRGTLLPWAQYWAWWLSGVVASEASALGCHSHLWQPQTQQWSALAQQRGWAARFAPLRPAWAVLGRVRAELAARLGLPPGLHVCTGVHDSNACLARYLRSHPRLTLVSTGTWVVVMAPGAPVRPLDPARDLLGNVSVRGLPVPTGRFMGGRELQTLCAGADPALASAEALDRVLTRGLLALPGFEPQGGPFRDRAGQVLDAAGQPVALAALPADERAALAALYAAQVSHWLIATLGAAGPVVVEGPFAANAVYGGVLTALCRAATGAADDLAGDASEPGMAPVQLSSDALEGTARGAWMLAHWTEPTITPAALATAPALPRDLAARVAAHHGRWLSRLNAPASGAAQPG